LYGGDRLPNAHKGAIAQVIRVCDRASGAGWSNCHGLGLDLELIWAVVSDDGDTYGHDE
jgi:hypothetical protein